MLASFTFSDAYPFCTLLAGLLVVIGGIVCLRLNAFLALIAAALVVSLMSAGSATEKLSRVVDAFGSTAAGVGIVISLAAIIGKAMTISGAADRIVQSFLGLLGEKRAATVLMSSGFVLAIPVFFDTVFYLLIPLVRSMYRRTGKHYLRYLLAISCCASAHALVPPTPGPLIVADAFQVDVGTMMMVGILVGFPASLAGMIFAAWADQRSPDMRPPADDLAEPTAAPTKSDEQRVLPGLWLSLAPIAIPVVLITFNSFLGSLLDARGIEKDIQAATATIAALDDQTAAGNATSLTVEAKSALTAAQRELSIAKQRQERLEIPAFLGNPNLALLISCAIALLTMWLYARPTPERFASSIEQALMSGGVIVLITCAGGAFGGALKQAGIKEAIEQLFGSTVASGIGLLVLSFGVASLLKFAQGSSTAAMIVTSGMIGAMIGVSGKSDPTTMGAAIGFHPVYLATAIGAGSLVGSWMNDSGFWIFAKMGGLTELQALKTWTPLLAILGIVAMIMTVILAIMMPMI